MPPRLASARRGPLLAILLIGVAAVALGACGRRGLPEPPSSASDARAPKRSAASSAAPAGTAAPARGPQAAPENTPEDETETADPTPSVSPQPVVGSTSRRRQPYVVPKEPFFLDPIL